MVSARAHAALVVQSALALTFDAWVAAVQMAKEERRAAAEAARAHALALSGSDQWVTHCSLEAVDAPFCAHYAYRSLRPWPVVVLGAAAPRWAAGWRMSGQLPPNDRRRRGRRGEARREAGAGAATDLHLCHASL